MRRGSYLGAVLNPVVVYPVMEPDDRTAEMLRHLDAPSRSSGQWDTKLRGVFARALTVMGAEAAKIARSSLLGGSFGSNVTAGMAAARWPPPALRARNRTEQPLLEWGRLAKSIRAEVDPSGTSVTVGVGGGTTQRHRRGQGTLPLARLALMLEDGFIQRVTPKAVAYFKFMAISSQRESSRRAEAGERQTFGAKKKMGRAATLSQQAKAWWYLYRRGEGQFAVPARPFLRPALEQAMSNFVEREAGGLGEAIARLWVTGIVPRGTLQGPTLSAGGD